MTTVWQVLAGLGAVGVLGAFVWLVVELARKATDAASQHLRADEAEQRARTDEDTIAQMRAEGADERARLDAVVAEKQAEVQHARDTLDEAARHDRALAHDRLAGVLGADAHSSDAPDAVPPSGTPGAPPRRGGG